MGSILNGISYFGLHRCSGSTFLVFADYMRAPMRVAALSELPVNYILTHDSIGVGEVREKPERPGLVEVRRAWKGWMRPVVMRRCVGRHGVVLLVSLRRRCKAICDFCPRGP